jgi:hypothetical protein
MEKEEIVQKANWALATLRSVLADIDLDPFVRFGISAELNELKKLSDDARNCRDNKNATSLEVERLNRAANTGPAIVLPPVADWPAPPANLPPWVK